MRLPPSRVVAHALYDKHTTIMKDNTDDYPPDVVVPATLSAIRRAGMIIGSCVIPLVAVVFGIFIWRTVFPTQVDVDQFNKWYDTNLTGRMICYKEDGFVDTEFYASIPMTREEFTDTIEVIGMQRSPIDPRHNDHNGPWWFGMPGSDVFILDRIDSNVHRDFIEGHYDIKRARGYFRYSDH